LEHTKRDEFSTSYTPKFLGETSIKMAFCSLELPTIIDSDTNTSLFFAIAIASSVVVAYCKISRVSKAIGVLATNGILDLPALMVTVIPLVFIPLTAPTKPGQV